MRIVKNNLFVFLFVVILSVPTYDFLHAGFPLTHDGKDHVVRVANFYQNLQSGNIVPRWAPNLNRGYGHPILMFLYPLPSYSASLLHFFGLSLIDSVKAVFVIAFIASGLSMYVLIKEMFFKEAGTVAALLYTYAPYRFVDMYVRGALGEHVAFIFPPLVFFFLYKLSKRYSNLFIIGGGAALAGLILSHNAISLMFLPFILLFSGILFRFNKSKKFLFGAVLTFILGFSLSAFFWMPAFLEGKYTLRDIVTKGEYVHHFVEPIRFLYSPWDYGISGQFSVQVGLFHWFVIILGIVVAVFIKKKKYPTKYLLIALLLVFILVLFLMTPQSNFIWKNVSILQKFQFPWRLISLIVFLTSFVGGLIFSFVRKGVRVVVLIISAIVIIFLNRNYWHAQSYFDMPDSFFNSVYTGTTDTGESAPIWSIRFMEENPKAPIESIEGSIEIKNSSRFPTRHTYMLTVKENSIVKENTLYFPGWKVFIDKKPVLIEFQNRNHHGIMTFPVEKGDHKVEVLFTETKLRLLANTISGVSLLFIIVYGFLHKKFFKQTA